MKVAIVWILGPLIAIGMAAVAGNSHDDSAEADQQDLQALHSRDFAARHVCKGQPFSWDDDKTLVCHREARP
jgi:hypothetical protein